MLDYGSATVDRYAKSLLSNGFGPSSTQGVKQDCCGSDIIPLLPMDDGVVV